MVGIPQCPSPIVTVPIFSTLSEAIHHQQQQKKQQQRQHTQSVFSQAARPQHAGEVHYASPHHTHADGRKSPATVGVIPTNFPYHPSASVNGQTVSISGLSHPQKNLPPRHASNALEGHANTQQVHLPPRQVFHRSHSIPLPQEGQGGASVTVTLAGGHDGRSLPRMGMVPHTKVSGVSRPSFR